MSANTGTLGTVGNKVRVSGTFRDEAGAVKDPTTVRCIVRHPNGAVVTRTYGVDGDVLRASEGVYTHEIVVTLPGTYNYRWESSGLYQGANEGRFAIRPTRV